MKRFYKNKNPFFEFWFLTITLIFVRLLDVYLTFKITPDLSFEANPLVLLGNQGWGTLLIINLFTVSISILLIFLANKFPPKLPDENDLNFKEFISYFLYNEKNSFYKIYFFVPYNRKAILSFSGFLFPRVFIFWSWIVVFHNLALLNSAYYQFYSHHWDLWLYMYFLLLPIVLFYFWNYFRVQYEKYKDSKKAFTELSFSPNVSP